MGDALEQLKIRLAQITSSTIAYEVALLVDARVRARPLQPPGSTIDAKRSLRYLRSKYGVGVAA
jgi:hypothetical protein